MTSGSVDDKLGSEEVLQDYKNRFPLFREYMELCDDLPIERTCVPETGGISMDLQVRFISDRFDTLLNGRDISTAIGRHESCEGALRKFCGIGVDYQDDPRGHRLANRAEWNEVAKLFPEMDPDEAWETYDDFVDPQVRKIERLGVYGSVDPRMDLYPYEGTDLYEAMQQAQRSKG